MAGPRGGSGFAALGRTYSEGGGEDEDPWEAFISAKERLVADVLKVLQPLFVSACETAKKRVHICCVLFEHEM